MEELQNLVSKLKISSFNDIQSSLYLTNIKEIKKRDRNDNLNSLIMEFSNQFNHSNSTNNFKLSNFDETDFRKKKSLMINKTHRKFFKPDYNNNGVLAGFRNNIKLDRMKVNSETKSAIHLLQKFEKLEKQYFVKGSSLKNLTELKMGNNKTLNRVMSEQVMKQGINKNIPNLVRTKSEVLNLNQEVKNERRKTFRVFPIKNWFEKNGFLPPYTSTSGPPNPEFQSGMIMDEIEVLLENIQFFKCTYLSGEEVINLFESISSSKQTSYNKLLEETCGLMMEISKIILVEFFDYMEKFVAVQKPNEEMLKDSIVKNETSTFYGNIKILNDVLGFFKSCFEVYKILVRQVDDMVIANNNYLKLSQYISRARYNVSSLIFTIKNHFINYDSDMKISNKYSINAFKDGNQVNEVKKDYKIYGDFANKSQPKIKEESIRIKRLNVILKFNKFKSRQDNDPNDSFEKKRKNASMRFKKELGIESGIISKMMKYCSKDIRNKIISERIISRFKEKLEES